MKNILRDTQTQTEIVFFSENDLNKLLAIRPENARAFMMSHGVRYRQRLTKKRRQFNLFNASDVAALLGQKLEDLQARLAAKRVPANASDDV